MQNHQEHRERCFLYPKGTWMESAGVNQKIRDEKVMVALSSSPLPMKYHYYDPAIRLFGFQLSKSISPSTYVCEQSYKAKTFTRRI
jgi:hypothetical protein